MMSNDGNGNMSGEITDEHLTSISSFSSTGAAGVGSSRDPCGTVFPSSVAQSTTTSHTSSQYQSVVSPFTHIPSSPAGPFAGTISAYSTPPTSPQKPTRFSSRTTSSFNTSPKKTFFEKPKLVYAQNSTTSLGFRRPVDYDYNRAGKRERLLPLWGLSFSSRYVQPAVYILCYVVLLASATSRPIICNMNFPCKDVGLKETCDKFLMRWDVVLSMLFMPVSSVLALFLGRCLWPHLYYNDYYICSFCHAVGILVTLVSMAMYTDFVTAVDTEYPDTPITFEIDGKWHYTLAAMYCLQGFFHGACCYIEGQVCFDRLHPEYFITAKEEEARRVRNIMKYIFKADWSENKSGFSRTSDWAWNNQDTYIEQRINAKELEAAKISGTAPHAQSKVKPQRAHRGYYGGTIY